jgi:hypothetical protein
MFWFQVFGYLAGLFVALAVGMWFGRRHDAINAINLAGYQDYAERLEREVAEAERIIRELTDARLADADALAASTGTPRRELLGFWARADLVAEQRANRKAN